MTFNQDTIRAGISMIQQVGFPIFVACWFMFRTDKYIKSNTESLNHLRKAIQVAYKMDMED